MRRNYGAENFLANVHLGGNGKLILSLNVDALGMVGGGGGVVNRTR